MLGHIRLALFLGYKSIVRGSRATIVLTISIMALAFVNLVFISSILNGVVVTSDRQINANFVSHVVVDPQEVPTQKDYIVHAEEVRRDIEHVPGVVATARRYSLPGTIAYDQKKNGRFRYRSTEVTGIDPEAEKGISEISQHMLVGSYLDGLRDDEIMIGASLAGGYEGEESSVSLGGAKVGEKFKITYRNGVVREYTIRGIFKVKLEYADQRAFVSLREAESVLSLSDSASRILVRTNNAAAKDMFAAQIQTLVPDLVVKGWDQYLGPMGGMSESLSAITVMISGIGLAVAAITIFILIYVSVVNKRRQIGILKAIGIHENIIIYSYIIQALFFALVGVCVGVVLVLYVIAPYFVKNPMELPMGGVSLALDNAGIIKNVVSLLIASLIAALIPARRAANENILKAIWGA